jgi:phosphopantetheinyl transferase (holo-ACP synthase)
MVPVRLENIRALKRIRAGFAGTVINVMARRKNGSTDRFEACIRLVQDFQSPDSIESAAMSCDLVFAAEAFRPAKTVSLKELVQDGRAPNLTPAQLYTPATMFHGPLMQCVSSLERLNKKNILARVKARDAVGWLPPSANPEFFLNPLLLDNVTQPVLFHLYEQGQAAHALLPFFVDSLEIFSDLNILRGEFFVHASLNSITNRGTEADVTLLAADGTPLAQFNNICSRRIVVAEPWSSHIQNPEQPAFNQPELPAHIPSSGLWTSCSLDASILPDEEVTLTWLLDYLLNPQEQRYAEQAITNGTRRREWVLGRIAAKEAVRRLLLQFHGIAIPLADIIIGRLESGKPWVCGEFVNYIGWAPSISISHKAGRAIALAAHPQVGASVGIDLEAVEQREEGFERLAFTEQERETIGKIPFAQKPVAMSAIWAAKESAAKALGIGMQNNPKNIQIRALLQPDSNLAFGVTWQAEIFLSGSAYNTTIPVVVFASPGEVFAMSYIPAADVQPVGASLG